MRRVIRATHLGTPAGDASALLEEFQRVSSGEEQGPLVGGFLQSLKKLFGG